MAKPIIPPQAPIAADGYFSSTEDNLTGWLWTGLIERIGPDQISSSNTRHCPAKTSEMELFAE